MSMTGTIRTLAEAGRAVDLDHALVSWSSLSCNRPTFGVYAVDYLRKRGLIVAIDGDHPDAVSLLQRGCTSDEVDDCACQQSAATGQQIADLLGLRDTSPYTMQALAMPVEEVADLLAALAERDLRWVPGEGGPNAERGTLIEGASEPPDLHVVFDAFRAAWQRDDEAADTGDRHWFGSEGRRATWNDLQRVNGPMTPDGGIAPTTPRAQP